MADFAWRIFDAVADIVGPQGAVAVLGVILIGAVYLVLSAGKKS